MRALRTLLVAASVLVPIAVSSAAEPVPVKVLLIGDSLSVGGFGDRMQELLWRKYGRQSVAIFASCGSSPEDWLKGGFVTRCGYRQTTPFDEILHEYENGERPRSVSTPKLRTVLSHYRPEVIIVQQGTNWMDALTGADSPDEARHRKIIADFVRELRRNNPGALLFWILPPSSASYPEQVHLDVDRWINEASRKMGFYTINSRTITGPYRKSKTGGDGVHYSDKAGGDWARAVYDKIAVSLAALPLAGSTTGP